MEDKETFFETSEHEPKWFRYRVVNTDGDAEIKGSYEGLSDNHIVKQASEAAEDKATEIIAGILTQELMSWYDNLAYKAASFIVPRNNMNDWFGEVRLRQSIADSIFDHLADKYYATIHAITVEDGFRDIRFSWTGYKGGRPLGGGTMSIGVRKMDGAIPTSADDYDILE